MEGGSLFNSGFLGASFNWWIGQIAADSTWRDNIAPAKFESPDQIPGWGRRYKVRIIGLHDQGESEIKSKELPWAQVMYPVTAGGGQGSSGQTPNLRQGNMVFGFFLDGQEQQVPVIMGVLGNNAQTPLATKIGDGKVTNASPGSLAVSGHAEPAIGTKDPNIKVPDDDKATTQGQGATKESADSFHQQSAADVKRLDLYLKKTVMLSPCDLPGSAMKAMQTEIENLTKEIDKILQSTQEYIDAVSEVISPLASIPSSPNPLQLNSIVGGISGNLLTDPHPTICPTNSPGAAPGVTNRIQSLLERFALILAKYMKIIFNKIMEYMLKKINEAIGPLADKLFPNQRFQFLDMKIEINELIKCLFSKISGGLGPQMLSALTDEIDVCNPSSGFSDGTGSDGTGSDGTGSGGTGSDGTGSGGLSSEGNAPLPPICSVERLTGLLIAVNEPEIKETAENIIKSIKIFVSDIRAAQPKGFTSDIGEIDISTIPSSTDSIIPTIPTIPTIPDFDGIDIPNISLNLISALSFENITFDIFGCDVKPNCAASDFYTLQEGSGAAEEPQEPRPAQVNREAIENSGANLKNEPPVPYATPAKNTPDLKVGEKDPQGQAIIKAEKDAIRNTLQL